MPTNVLTPILKLDAYEHLRQNDQLSAELTPAEFATLANRNRWQPVTIGLLVKPPPPRRSIRMGRLQITLVDE